MADKFYRLFMSAMTNLVEWTEYHYQYILLIFFFIYIS